MVVFVDSSAFYSAIDGSDEFHEKSKQTFEMLFSQKQDFVTSNYVVVETLTLLQNRLGISDARNFSKYIIPLIKIIWVEEWMHEAGLNAMLTAGKRKLSLVDCVSFEIMRRLGIETAFTFDRHFKLQGFKCIPA